MYGQHSSLALRATLFLCLEVIDKTFCVYNSSSPCSMCRLQLAPGQALLDGPVQVRFTSDRRPARPMHAQACDQAATHSLPQP